MSQKMNLIFFHFLSTPVRNLLSFCSLHIKPTNHLFFRKKTATSLSCFGVKVMSSNLSSSQLQLSGLLAVVFAWKMGWLGSLFLGRNRRQSIARWPNKPPSRKRILQTKGNGTTGSNWKQKHVMLLFFCVCIYSYVYSKNKQHIEFIIVFVKFLGCPLFFFYAFLSRRLGGSQAHSFDHWPASRICHVAGVSNKHLCTVYAVYDI